MIDPINGKLDLHLIDEIAEATVIVLMLFFLYIVHILVVVMGLTGSSVCAQ